MFRKSFLSDL